MRLGWKVLIPIGFAAIVIFGRVDDFTAEFVEISFRRHRGRLNKAILNTLTKSPVLRGT